MLDSIVPYWLVCVAGCFDGIFAILSWVGAFVEVGAASAMVDDALSFEATDTCRQYRTWSKASAIFLDSFEKARACFRNFDSCLADLNDATDAIGGN